MRWKAVKTAKQKECQNGTLFREVYIVKLSEVSVK